MRRGSRGNRRKSDRKRTNHESIASVCAWNDVGIADQVSVKRLCARTRARLKRNKSRAPNHQPEIIEVGHAIGIKGKRAIRPHIRAEHERSGIRARGIAPRQDNAQCGHPFGN